MVLPTQTRSTPKDDPLGSAIQTRIDDIESAKYSKQTETVLRRFASWAGREHDITHPQDITPKVLREFSRELADSVRDESHPITSNSTAEQYFAVLSAFLSWAVREELIDTNPALVSRASEPLPSSDEHSSQQFWSERDRDAICATADRLVDEVLAEDHGPLERTKTFRDRALVYTLGYTGCRGAEPAAVKDDPKRDGLRWTSVDLDAGTLSVYGKNRTREEAPIFAPAVEPLRRWKRVLDPDSHWPVFPTMHLPSLYGELPDDAEASPDTVWTELGEHDREPPSIQVGGMRTVLGRLCDESRYEYDETLRPHGARRGLGDQLYEEQAELAQEALRHRDIETTHQSYRKRKTRRVKERGDEVLGN